VRAHEARDAPSAHAPARVGEEAGYKWLRRFEAEGVRGLAERSRRPQGSPRVTAPESVAALVELWHRHPSWGAKKLVAVLAQRHPCLTLLAPSTAAAILTREGSFGRPGAAWCGRTRGAR
jgi:hypothetical protein